MATRYHPITTRVVRQLLTLFRPLQSTKSREHIRAWLREEVTANTRFDTAAQARAAIDPVFAGLAARAVEVKHRCGAELQIRAEAFDVRKTA
jgi:hypothetical protein